MSTARAVPTQQIDLFLLLASLFTSQSDVSHGLFVSAPPDRTNGRGRGRVSGWCVGDMNRRRVHGKRAAVARRKIDSGASEKSAHKRLPKLIRKRQLALRLPRCTDVSLDAFKGPSATP
jgi:hypothetical protein